MANHRNCTYVDAAIIQSGEQPVVDLINPNGRTPIVLVCEHASRRIPQFFVDLGLPAEALSSHIAWDPGAFDVAVTLSRLLDAPLVASTVSRLIYDCNRPPESDTAIPLKSEHYDIPGNAALNGQQRLARINAVYRPFEHCLAEAIAAKRSTEIESAIITIHSFTPVYLGVRRTVEVGILHGRDTRLADALLSIESTLLRFERNQPYGPNDGVLHTLDLHGNKNDLPNAMIEIRNDLVASPESVYRISNSLHLMIDSALHNVFKNKY